VMFGCFCRVPSFAMCPLARRVQRPAVVQVAFCGAFKLPSVARTRLGPTASGMLGARLGERSSNVFGSAGCRSSFTTTGGPQSAPPPTSSTAAQLETRAQQTTPSTSSTPAQEPTSPVSSTPAQQPTLASAQQPAPALAQQPAPASAQQVASASAQQAAPLVPRSPWLWDFLSSNWKSVIVCEPCD